MQAFARHVLPVLGLLAIALAPSRALGLCQAPRNEVVSPLATAAGDGFLVAWTFAFATPKSSGVKLLEVARDGAPRTEPTTLDLGATPVALWTGADGSPMFFGVRPGAGLVTGRLAKGAAPQPFSAGGLRRARRRPRHIVRGRTRRAREGPRIADGAVRHRP